MSITFDVLGLGCIAVDELLRVPAYPKADGKVQILQRERHCGGLTATALVAAARLGARCAYAGVLGRPPDPNAQFILNTLRREKVHVRHAIRRAGVQPVRSVVIVVPDRGTRAILYDTTNAGGADPRHPPRSLIESSRVLLVDRFGIAGMIRAARLARAAGRPVVGDFESGDEPRLSELLRLVNHLILPELAAAWFTGQSRANLAVTKLIQRGHSVAVVTSGDRGCWYQGPGMSQPVRQPAFKVPIVDTTGCGDVFHGAYAAALARGLPLAERVRLASAAAALKASSAGGQQGCPMTSELRDFLNHPPPLRK